MSWRDILKIHPAAELFPLMAPEELKALGEDIKANGLQQPIILWRATPDTETMLLDGRNRLDAMELVGLPTVGDDGKLILDNRMFEETTNPQLYVSSANIHRRHLTVGQRRQAIAKLIAADPARSDRLIAKDARVDHKTVAAIRKEYEELGKIPQLKKRVGGDGKARAMPDEKPKPPKPKRRFTLIEFIEILPKSARPPAGVLKQATLDTNRYSGEEALAKLKAFADKKQSATTAPVLEPFYGAPEADFDLAPQKSEPPLRLEPASKELLRTIERALRELATWKRDIAKLPEIQRVVLARGFLNALSITMTDLAPIETTKPPVVTTEEVRAAELDEVKAAEPDSEIVAAMRADHEAGMPIAKIARKHGFRYINVVREALGLEERP